MYAARRNRIRLRTTLVLMIAAMIVGAMLSLQVAHQQLLRINEASRNRLDSTEEKIDWMETMSVLGEEVILFFINLTSEAR
jgi:hypothetical protein